MLKVSFIVIAYNIKGYIERCIKSILDETLEEIEIIIVDDGSTDGTLDIIKTLSEKNKKIKMITQVNKGANEARKVGLKYATGKYVVFVDGDDWIDKNLAEDMYELAEKKNVDIICFEYYLANENGKNIKNKSEIYDNIEKDKFLDLILQQKISHNIWNKFIKLEFINKTNFKNVIGLSMGEDLADNVLFGIGKPKVIMIDKAYYYYYQRSNSSMHKSSVRILEIEKVLNYIEDILKENNIFYKYREEMAYLWFLHCYNKIFNSQNKIDNIHKKLYKIWKNKNIDISENKYCIEFEGKLKGIRKLAKKAFDINFYMGALILNVRYIIKNKTIL